MVANAVVKEWITADEYEPIKAERQALRDRINELEAML